jgi:dihydrofolate reductase
MRISLIVAMDRNGLIGSDRGLPWHLSADLKRFRKLTTGKPIIMGRKTLKQIGGPLKDRLNIVLTRQPDFAADGCAVTHSIEEALTLAWAALPNLGADEIMVIGGAEVYGQALPFVERICLTIVAGEFTGNAWFPLDGSFKVKIAHDEHIPADAKNPHAHRFLILERLADGIAIGEILIS